MDSQAALRLYRFPLSGHCHRVELLLSLAELPCELITVDLAAGAQRQPAFLRKNSWGQVPVLEHGQRIISDSNAILVYLAETFEAAARYWPADAFGRAQVVRWFSVAAGPLAHGPGAARLIRVFGRDLDHARALATAGTLFEVLSVELAERPFLAGDAVTLADLAMYTYTAHAPEGDVSLEAYPRIQSWLARIEALPRFVAMQRAQRR